MTDRGLRAWAESSDLPPDELQRASEAAKLCERAGDELERRDFPAAHKTLAEAWILVEDTRAYEAKVWVQQGCALLWSLQDRHADELEQLQTALAIAADAGDHPLTFFLLRSIADCARRAGSDHVAVSVVAASETDSFVDACGVLWEGADEARTAGDLAQAIGITQVRGILLDSSREFEERALNDELLADLLDQLGEPEMARQRREHAAVVREQAI
jgi:hypothetical protein